MRTVRFILIIVIAGMIGYYLGVTRVSLAWKNFKPNITVSSKEPPSMQQRIDFSPMWVVLDKLQTSYYNKEAFDGQKLLNGAISGMVDSLNDPYTVYLPPQQNDDFKQGLAGEFEGIGAELGLRGKQIYVVEPLGGSPAQNAGIRIGDAIIKVDGEVTTDWTLQQAVEKIRGKKGTKVVLTIVHKDETKPVDIPVTRDKITVKSVSSWVKAVKDVENIKLSDTLKKNADQKVAYIRLSQFGDNTNQEWLQLTNKLDMQFKQDKNIKGVILDLRNNPGGYLTDAVFITSEFIKSGTVVIQEDSRKERARLDVSREGLLTDIPLIVLINKGSASASEIVAGALQDHNRATILGETSFGKGTIQQAEDLGGGAGLHVTIAKWLTPDGTWVHQKGLKPDVEVKLNAKEPTHDVQIEKAIEELVK